MSDVRDIALCLYLFSGPHLGARIDLPTGDWVLGTDDASDIILHGLAARHANLHVEIGSDGIASLAVTGLDGSVRLTGASEVREEGQPWYPPAGEAWYLGQTCLAWNLPGVAQAVILPETKQPSPEISSHSSGETPADVPVPEVSSNPPDSTPVSVSQDAEENANNVLTLLPDQTATQTRQPRPLRRAALLGLVAAGLIGVSLVLTPSGTDPRHYPEIIKKYLEDAGIGGLQVISRSPGVEVRGTLDDEAALVRLRDMARSLQIPVYLEVAVQADMLRAVRSSLGIRGFQPEVTFWKNGGSPRLQIAAYMKDELLEAAAFTALKNDVQGLPEVDRRIVHEKELAPVLEAALKQAGLTSVRAIYLPGQVDFSGDFRPEDSRKLDAIRKDAEELFGVRIPGTSSVSGALAAARQSLAPSREQAPAQSQASPAATGGNPLGGLRVTGVTMTPMRFVTTADGRRLFEGAVLPSGWTLESIDTKVLVLRNGSQVVSHRLRGK